MGAAVAGAGGINNVRRAAQAPAFAHERANAQAQAQGRAGVRPDACGRPPMCVQCPPFARKYKKEPQRGVATVRIRDGFADRTGKGKAPLPPSGFWVGGEVVPEGVQPPRPVP